MGGKFHHTDIITTGMFERMTMFPRHRRCGLLPHHREDWKAQPQVWRGQPGGGTEFTGTRWCFLQSITSLFSKSDRAAKRVPGSEVLRSW